MRLSEAIDLIGMATPQGFGVRSMYSDEAPCALGAVRMALGIPACDEFVVQSRLRRAFPLLDSPATCPQCNEWWTHSANTWSVIWHLNDSHQWSRSQVAAWVRTIEAAQPAPVESEVEGVHV